MPRRSVSLIAAFASLPFLLGMGALGGEQTGRIPKSLEDQVAAEVTDASGTRVRLEKLNIDGDEFVRARLGRGVVVVPFTEIREVVFGTTEGRVRRARATLADGRAVDVQIDADTEFSGASALPPRCATICFAAIIMGSPPRVG